MPKETVQEESAKITPEESKELEELTKLITDFIDRINLPQKIEVIDDIIHQLNFLRRFSLLSDKEKKFITEDGLAFPIEHQRIENAKSKEIKDKLINNLARTIYFRKIAWVAYLNGEKEKPYSDSINSNSNA